LEGRGDLTADEMGLHADTVDGNLEGCMVRYDKGVGKMRGEGGRTPDDLRDLTRLTMAVDLAPVPSML
jgi:hypothetical protein